MSAHRILMCPLPAGGRVVDFGIRASDEGKMGLSETVEAAIPEAIAMIESLVTKEQSYVSGHTR